jgi:probable F420-dependent oxidoreductase
MSHFPHRGFRFGIQVSKASSAQDWAELARRAEGAGYDVLTMPDHFTDQLAPMPALMAAASATTTLRVGALVFDNDYKHPLVLAKELATMDVLSDGRTEIGLGAGWMISDYEEAGIPYDSPKVRIDRFVEGLAVIKGVMRQGPFSFSGDHYTITNYEGHPKPVQQPLPPILIGGGGKRVLTFAAREADIIGINGTLTAGVVGPEALSTMTAESVDEKVDIVAEAAKAAGRLADIEMNIRTFFVKVTDDRDKTVDGISQMFGVSREMINSSPFALIGSVESCIEQLLERREKWGFSYTIVGGENIDECAPIVAALSGK